MRISFDMRCFVCMLEAEAIEAFYRPSHNFSSRNSLDNPLPCRLHIL